MITNSRFLYRFCAVLACLATPLAAKELRFVAAPSNEALSPGAPQFVTVYVMNEGAAPEKFVAPGVIAAKLVHGDRALPVELVPEAAAREVTIQPGAFVAIRCQLVVPEDASARSVVVVDQTVVDTVDSAKPQAAREADGAVPAEVPSSKQTVAEAGLVEYRPLQFSAHEPIYILIGTDQPNGKFQFSFKYQIVPADSPLGKAAPWATGFHIGYTQYSFWDLEGDSKPFFDSSYKPELLWIWDNIRPGDFGPISRFDVQLGVQHESNGGDGENSRSLNIVYVRPVVTFGERDSWFVSVGPRVWTYIGSLDDNDDIEEFRGYGDLKVVAGKGDGLQVAAVGRIGSDFDKGSLQIDVSYPIRKALFDSIDVYLHGQLFTGYGESLLGYNDGDTNFRVGISLVR